MRVSLLFAAAAAVMLPSFVSPLRAQPCPPAPTGVSYEIAACQARISWTFAANPVAFQVYRGLGATIAGATFLGEVDGSERLFTQFQDGDPTHYNYFIRARIAPTAECPSGVGFAAVINVDPSNPPTPTNVQVIESCTGATILWDDSPSALWYTVAVLHAPDEPPLFEIDVVDPPVVWTNTGGPPATLLVIRPHGSCGANPYPAELMLDLPPTPLAPTDFAASDTLPCRVDITWTPNPWHAGGYRVYRNDDLIATLGAMASSFADLAAPPDQVSTYRVVAFTTCGEAAESPDDTGVAPSSFALVSELPRRVLPGQTAVLSVPDAPGGSGFTYSWRRGVGMNGAGGTPVTNDGRVSGADSPTLSIAAARPTDAEFYALDVFSPSLPCGSRTTVVPLVVPTVCAADFDGSGALGVPDIFAFLSAWFAGCP